MITLKVKTNIENDLTEKVKRANELIDELGRLLYEIKGAKITLNVETEKTSSAATDEENGTAPEELEKIE